MGEVATFGCSMKKFQTKLFYYTRKSFHLTFLHGSHPVAIILKWNG